MNTRVRGKIYCGINRDSIIPNERHIIMYNGHTYAILGLKTSIGKPFTIPKNIAVMYIKRGILFTNEVINNKYRALFKAEDAVFYKFNINVWQEFIR